MDHRLIEGLMEAIAPLIKTYVDERIAKEVAPLHARLKGFEDFQPLYIDFSKKLGDIPDKTVSEQIKDLRDVVDALNERPIRDGEDGKDADPEVVKEMVLKAIDVKSIGDQVLASIPVPQNGKDAEPVDPAEVAKFLVDLMPVAKDGKDVDMVEVERLVLAITDQKFALREAIHDETVRPIVEEVVAAHVAKIAPAEPGRDGKDADIEVVRAIIVEEVAKVAPADGKDADPEVIRSMVVEEVAKVEVPAGKDGQSVTIDDVRPLIEEMVAALPPAAPGKDADPVEVAALILEDVAKLIPIPADGKSVTIEEVLPHLEKMVEALPKAVNGKDADPAEVAALIVEDVAKLVPRPADGKSITVDDVLPAIEESIEKKIAALPKPKDGVDGRDGKDGVGMAGAVLGRDGELVLTLSNGATKDLGVIVGKDGEPGQPGKDGRDGFSLKDFDTELLEDGRTVLLKFGSGDILEIHELVFPVVLDQGVFKEGAVYQRGDGVTFGGSFWIAQKDTPEGKPQDGSKDWRLAVKKGRQGQDGVVRTLPPQGPVKA